MKHTGAHMHTPSVTNTVSIHRTRTLLGDINKVARYNNLLESMFHSLAIPRAGGWHQLSSSFSETRPWCTNISLSVKNNHFWGASAKGSERKAVERSIGVNVLQLSRIERDRVSLVRHVER
jgi:hypothetical protein